MTLDHLLQQVAQLPPVPAEAAAQYDASRGLLLEHVNEDLSARPEIETLIGRDSLRVMHDNHAHHVAFMANVFKLNDFGLLARIIPWVYRTYHTHGFSYDYFPLELEAWISAIQTNLDAQAVQAITPIYRWMLDRHADMVQLAEDRSYVTLPASQAWDPQAESFLSALLAIRQDECRQIAEQATRQPQDLAELYLRILQPALYRIGTLWENNEISVAQEHAATAIVLRVMGMMCRRLPTPQQTRGEALVTAAPQELHEVGARMVADLLEQAGWRVIYLGANMPASDLVDFIGSHPPDLVAISAAMPLRIDAIQTLCRRIRARLRPASTRIIVGGQVFMGVDNLWRVTGADGYGQDARAAVQLAEQWWQQSHSG